MDAELPDAIVEGKEPLIVLGAIAGAWQSIKSESARRIRLKEMMQ
jgi:hypothetical protein